jgi:hypothetical protein
MFQKHVLTIEATSIQRTLAHVRAIALPFIFVATAGVGGIVSLLLQPTPATDYAWCTQREGAV